MMAATVTTARMYDDVTTASVPICYRSVVGSGSVVEGGSVFEGGSVVCGDNVEDGGSVYDGGRVCVHGHNYSGGRTAILIIWCIVYSQAAV